MTPLKRGIKRQVGRAARLYHRLRASTPIWRFLNRRGRALARGAAPLSAREQAIVEELGERGIAVVPVTDLIPAAAFDELRRYAEARWEAPEVQARAADRGDALVGGKPRSKDYFLVELWEGPHALDLANPFVRFSVNESILRIINAYLETAAKFRGFALQATVPTAPGERRYASQEWHRDPEDRRLVKTFLYLSDVGEENGPFVYLPGSHEGGKWRGLFPQQPPRGSAGVEESIPMHDVISCIGKAGAFILCDTSGLHRGGQARAGKRLMYTSVYATEASPWPVIYTEGPPLPAGLSPEVAFALNNDLHQREPRFYKM